jgi:hypothetical protein
MREQLTDFRDSVMTAHTAVECESIADFPNWEIAALRDSQATMLSSVVPTKSGRIRCGYQFGDGVVNWNNQHRGY